MSFYSCFKSIIKLGKTTLTGNDAGVVPVVQSQYMNKVSNVNVINPAGFSHCPLSGNLVLLFNIGAVEDNISGIVTDQLNRIKNLAPGETVVYNTENHSYIKINADASITVSAPVINFIGDVNISGNLNVDGQTNLGIGGDGIARLGDQVTVTTDTGTWTGSITGASTNNTAN